MSSLPEKSIAVVGGGLSGIAAASELAAAGRVRTVLFEKEGQLGGLSGWYEWGDLACDRFYHVILSTDLFLREHVRDIGLEPDLYWQKTRTGFFGGGRLVSFSSVGDYLRFPFLTPVQKLRLGAGILFAAHFVKSEKLAGRSAPEWLTKTFGGEIYRKIWDPLLRSKLGSGADRVPAAFIQATIKRLYGARSLWSKQESMGHVRGGYRRILTASRDHLQRKGVEIRENAGVLEVGLAEGSRKPYLRTSAAELKFDKVLLAVPPPAAAGVLNIPEAAAAVRSLQRVDHLGIICVLLVLRRRLSPYYVINLLDPELPFTGVVETTNIIPPRELGGRHLVYLPKYIAPGDPLNGNSDEQIIDLFLGRLRRVFPRLTAEDVLHRRVFRADYAQPLGPPEGLDSAGGYLKLCEDVYLLDRPAESRFVPNNNTAVRFAREAARDILAGISER